MQIFNLKYYCLLLAANLWVNGMQAGNELLTGDLNRVVVMARFNGDPDFDESKSYYDEFFNGQGERSVKSYFSAISNQKLNVNSLIFPKAAQDKSYELKYCFFCYESDWSKDFPACKGKDISSLADISVGFVIKELAAQVEPEMDEAAIDKDNDGYVDQFVVVLRGNSRGKDQGIHTPHNGEISERFTTTNGEITLKGKKIKRYTIVYERTSLDTQCRFLLNEMGFPNLYRNRTLYARPVGVWDPMDGPELTYPLVYNRLKYSNNAWVESIPAVESYKTYVLNSSDKVGNTAYRIGSDSPGEFFVVEYRNNTSAYNRHLPEPGMLVYRVNENGSGSTDQIPEFYLFRKDGTLTVPGDLLAAPFSDGNGRSAFNATTNPRPFSGNGESVNLSLSNIRITGETLSFDTEAVPATGLQTAGSEVATTVYPNPSRGVVNMTGNWNRAVVYNLYGAPVFDGMLVADAQVNTIDLQHLTKGVYILELRKGESVKREKITLY